MTISGARLEVGLRCEKASFYTALSQFRLAPYSPFIQGDGHKDTNIPEYGTPLDVKGNLQNKPNVEYYGFKLSNHWAHSIIWIRCYLSAVSDQFIPALPV